MRFGGELPKSGVPITTPAGQSSLVIRWIACPAASLFASALVTLTLSFLVSDATPAPMVTLSGLTSATTESCWTGVGLGVGVARGVSVGFGPGALDDTVRLAKEAWSPAGIPLPSTALPQPFSVTLPNEPGAVHKN